MKYSEMPKELLTLGASGNRLLVQLKTYLKCWTLIFEVLDSVTIARSRKHIQKYYDTTDIGTFPIRLKPLSPRPHLTDLKTAINYNEIFEQLMLLTLTIYTPTHYILRAKWTSMQNYTKITKSM